MRRSLKTLFVVVIVLLLLAETAGQFAKVAKRTRRKNAKDLHVGPIKKKNHTSIEQCRDNCTALYPHKRQAALLQECSDACDPHYSLLEWIASLWSIFGCIFAYLLYKLVKRLLPKATVESTAVGEHRMLMQRSKKTSASKQIPDLVDRLSEGKWELDYEQKGMHDISLPFNLHVRDFPKESMLYQADIESKDRNSQACWKGKAYFSVTKPSVKVWIEKTLQTGQKFAYEGTLVGEACEGHWRAIGSTRETGLFSMHRIKHE